MISKAGINSQSGDKIGALEQAIADLQQQMSELGGGVFKTKFYSKELIQASGVTGTIISIPAPPEGQLIRLTTLTTNSTTLQGGISVVANGGTVVSGELTPQTVASGEFGISDYYGGANSSIVVRLMSPIVAESIQIIKDAGNTTQGIRYAYEYGAIE